MRARGWSGWLGYEASCPGQSGQSGQLRGLLVAVGRCNARVRLSLIYVPVSLLDLRYLGSSEEGLTFGHT